MTTQKNLILLKQLFLAFLLVSALAACGSGGGGSDSPSSETETEASSGSPEPTESDDESENTGEPGGDSEEQGTPPAITIDPNEGTTPVSAQGAPFLTNSKHYVFGHSLIVHSPPAIPTPSNETTVPHWMKLLSNAAGFGYTVDGQYGFLPGHANLPPNPIWGFDIIEGTNAANEFSDNTINTVWLTAANFIQATSPTTPYDAEGVNDTNPVDATLNIVDWVRQQAPGASIYIYENWPEMGGNVFPPSSETYNAYIERTLGEFHAWWITYHDAVRSARPSANVKMIPVGPIIAKLLSETNLSQIPVTDLYEDGDPHGRPTIYFLASLITYMAHYGQQPPESFEAPDIVHSLVRENYTATVDFIWRELEYFTDAQGNSRVW